MSELEKKIIVVKTGDTFASIKERFGDFEDWIIKGLNVLPEDTRVVDAAREEQLPELDTCRSAVIAGSHEMVTQNFGWSLRVESWVAQLVENRIPVLGICYGHQLLAKAVGGIVDYHPKGIEIGTVEIRNAGGEEWKSDGLFSGLPDPFKVHACHSQTVVALPDRAVLLARNAYEPHHAFRIGPNAWGVQFHPEYDGDIMQAYIQNMEDIIVSSKQAPATVLAAVEPTPVAAEILTRFGCL